MDGGAGAILRAAVVLGYEGDGGAALGKALCGDDRALCCAVVLGAGLAGLAQREDDADGEVVRQALGFQRDGNRRGYRIGP